AIRAVGGGPRPPGPIGRGGGRGPAGSGERHEQAGERGSASSHRHPISSANVATEPLRAARVSGRGPARPGLPVASGRILSRKSFRLLRITTCGDSLFTGGGVTRCTRNL